MLRTLPLLVLALAACNGDPDESGTESGTETGADSGTTTTNTPPEITVDGDSMVRSGTALSYTVTLVDDDVDGVTLTVSSSDTSVIADADITVSGTGADRTVSVATASVGSTTLTFTASDAEAEEASATAEAMVVTDRTAWTGFTVRNNTSNEALNDLTGGPGGAIYSVGWTRPSRFEATVTSWGADGTSAWQTNLVPPADAQGNRVAVMPSGGVFFASQAKLVDGSNYQFAYGGTVGTDGSGPTEQQRLDVFDGAGGNYTVPGGLAVADDGSYVMGAYGVWGTLQGCGVGRFASDGTEVFATELASGNIQCRQPDVAVDGDATYFTLASQSAQFDDAVDDSWDSWVGKLDAAGAVAWTDHLTGTGDQWATRLKVDADGNLYMCGGSVALLDDSNTSAGDRDAILRKYDPSGTVLWTARWGTDGLDQCYGLDFDHEGNIYTASAVQYDTQASISTLALAAFSPDGTQLWSVEHPSSEPRLNLPRGIVVDGFDVIVGGYRSVEGNGREAFIGRFDLQGALQ